MPTRRDPPLPRRRAPPPSSCRELVRDGDLVLLKASRGIQLEVVAKAIAAETAAAGAEGGVVRGCGLTVTSSGQSYPVFY